MIVVPYVSLVVVRNGMGDLIRFKAYTSGTRFIYNLKYRPMGSLIHTVRNRYTVRYLLTIAVFLALVYGFTREIDFLIVMVYALALGETIQILRENPLVDNRWVQVGIGSVVSVVSLVWLVYELTISSGTDGPVWFPVLTTFIGIWFLLDARTDVTEGTQYGSSPQENMDANEIMLIMNHGHLLIQVLEEGPKTISKLAENCDLTESRVKEALEHLIEQEIVYRVKDTGDAERYALDETKVGPVAFVRSTGNAIARPFQL